MNDATTPENVPVSWPLGPLYYELPGADGSDARSWVNYKLSAAHWYIRTLQQLIDEAGFERYVGVEMALDGALSSLNGAFDAAVGGLIRAAEMYLLKDEIDPVFTRPHEFKDWVFVKRMAELDSQKLDIDVAGVAAKVASALEIGPDRDNPTGWLQQFRRLRNTPMHQTTAPRHIEVVVGTDAVTSLFVAGNAQAPVEYLTETKQKVLALTGPILGIIDHIIPHGIPSLRPLRKPEAS